VYSDRDELVRRFGEREILALEDQNGTGTPDSDVTDAALEDATAEIDSYLAVRYTLPLNSIPAPIVKACCDIARYLLYKDHPVQEAKDRYLYTIDWLKLVSSGRVVLPIDPPSEVNTVLPIAGVFTGGVFSDRVLNMMPTPILPIYWVAPRKSWTK
jgi:phage gp36-like protein